MEPSILLKNLKMILTEREPARTQLINLIQTTIWNDEAVVDDRLNQILSELAYDLDFYQPNQKMKESNINYYDNDDLRDIVNCAIKRIEEYYSQEL